MRSLICSAAALVALGAAANTFAAEIIVLDDLRAINHQYESAFLGGSDFGTAGPPGFGESWLDGRDRDRVTDGGSFSIEWDSAQESIITATSVSGLLESSASIDMALDLGGAFIGSSIESMSRMWLTFQVTENTQAQFSSNFYEGLTSLYGSSEILFELGIIGGEAGGGDGGGPLFTQSIVLDSPEYQAGGFGSEWMELTAGTTYYLKVITTAGASVTNAPEFGGYEEGIARAFYNFEIIPAPASFVLLVGAAFGGRRRRRREV